MLPSLQPARAGKASMSGAVRSRWSRAPIVGVVSPRLLLALPDRERGCAEDAHDQRHRNQSRPTAIACPLLTPERVQEQHERTFAHAEAVERERQHLHHRDRGHVRERSPASGTGRSSVRKMSATVSTTESW